MMSVYNELRLEQTLCDALIRVDDFEFSVHKLILCNCSLYFKALFTHWSTPDCRVFDIPNVSADMMKIIIDFAYTNSAPVTQKNVQELFIAADQFDVVGLVQACSDFLEEQLTPQNCIGIWGFTDVYYTPELNNKAFLFILNNFTEVAAFSEEFLQLSVQQLVKITESDKLNVKKENIVFRAILRWITYEPEERRQYISVLLPKVRLALTTAEFIMDSVNNNELVKASEECEPILIRALQAMLDLQTKKSIDFIIHNPLARPRLPTAILLAVGGYNRNSPTNAMEAYDVRADCWVNATINETAPRAYHSIVFLDGHVYCVGGFNSLERFRSVLKYDLVTYNWQEVAHMHSRRCYVSVTVMDGCIYAIGGFDGENRLNTAERYQPGINQWTLIAPMNEQRSDANCTALNGKVYVCGGFNGDECLFTAECYNPGTNQWTMIAPMGNGRSGVGVIAYAGHVFAVGGFNGTSRLDSVEAYSPRTNTWHDVPSMLNARSNFGIAVMDDRLFVVGGFSGQATMHDVECYDVAANEWSEARGLEIARSALSCCVVYGFPNLSDYAAPHHSLQFSEEEEEEEEEGEMEQ